MNWYLIIDKFNKEYILKTSYVIRRAKIATEIAQKQGIIDRQNYVVYCMPLTPINYLMFLIKKIFCRSNLAVA